MKQITIGLFVAVLTFSVGIVAKRLLAFPEIVFTQIPQPIDPLESGLTENSISADIGPSSLEEYRPTPDGVYFPTNEGNMDLDTALIVSILDDGEAIAEVKVGEKFYRNNFIKINSQQLKFTTESVKNINYEFEGHFLRNGFKDHFEDGDIVLRGKLKKFVKGKMVFGVTKRFLYASEVCAWNPNNQ